MVGCTVLHILDLLLWMLMAASAFYVIFFAWASLLPRRKEQTPREAATASKFLILFPAYKEDSVIIHSVETFLRQNYPGGMYRVAVISDRMQAATNEHLAALPITLLTPSFLKSSKAMALQYAMSQMETAADGVAGYSHVVILDADNVVGADFLSRLDVVCRQGYRAIQCHRTAKNSDNDVAVLDAVSEEINNSIFRKGHNRVGLSSALIGSGMCFSYDWFRSHVDCLDSAVEDRELESLLMKEDVFVYYAEDIPVMDEKVSSHDNFQRQRLRWMTGQVQTLLRMVPWLPTAFMRANINYIDKTLQQALIPRSILLVAVTLLTMLVTLLDAFSPLGACMSKGKWWGLLALLCLSLLLAMPAHLRTGTVLSHVLLLPRLTWRMVKNLAHINIRSKDFLHTTHGKS